MRNVSDKSHGENQNAHSMFSNVPPPQKNHAVYEVVVKIWCTARQATGDNTIQHMQ